MVGKGISNIEQGISNVEVFSSSHFDIQNHCCPGKISTPLCETLSADRQVRTSEISVLKNTAKSQLPDIISLVF